MHCIHLLVLLWKNWILHRRYYYVTTFEILSPVLPSLVLVLVIAVESSYKEVHTGSKNIHQNETKYKSFNPVTSLTAWSMLYYTPNCSSADRLMQTAFKDSNMHLMGFPSERDIINEAKLYNVRKTLLGSVVLYNFNGSVMPLSLKYKISINPWSSYSIDPPDVTYYGGGIGYRLQDYSSYRRSGFLAIQILIDLAFIELSVRSEGRTMPKVEILIKRMPVPSFTSFDIAKERIIIIVIPFYLCVGLLLFFVIVVKRLVDEKNNRAKEMMKMMGMSTTDYWGSVFFSNFIIAIIICIAVTITYSIPASAKGSVLRHTSASLFFVIILLYCASSLLLCFVITILFSRVVFASVVVIALWIFSLAMANSNAFLPKEFHMKMIACLIPNMAIHLVLQVTFFHELMGIGSRWNNVMEPSPTSRDNFSVGLAIVMMLLSCVLYTALLLYLDVIWPWQPGVPKAPLFFLEKSFWYPPDTVISTEIKDDVQVKTKYFEETQSDLTPSVVICHLTKVFGRIHKKTAVDNLSLSMYPGQITALLGQNGAGKSTTMNILTGMFPPTYGTAIINGHDIVKDTNAARRNLGLCPEYSVLYDSLTVEEHLKLFAGLKGMRWWAITEDMRYLLRRFHLLDKLDALSRDLSGGMRRKLSLANAIIGKPKILILDEPTRGLDPESRRRVWNLLEELRPNCTMLLTTHHMEEADALGDQIAIMACGRLQCCGSSMFLKRIFEIISTDELEWITMQTKPIKGTKTLQKRLSKLIPGTYSKGAGYHLRIEKGKECRVDAITDLVRRYVPEAKLTRNVRLELIYSLSNEVKKFSELFEELENSFEPLDIRSCGVDVTTMDEVFMKVAEMTEEHYQMNEKGKIRVSKIDEEGTLFKQFSTEAANRGLSETFQQMEALFIKRAKYAKRNLLLLIFQVVLPLIAILLFVCLDDVMTIHAVPAKEEIFSFDLCNKFRDRKYGIFYVENNKSASHRFAAMYEQILHKECVIPLKIEDVDDLDKYLLQVDTDNVHTYIRQYLVGAGVKENGDNNFRITAWFNGIHYHLDPISINLVTNTILSFSSFKIRENIRISAQLLSERLETPVNIMQPSGSFRQSFNIIFLPMALTFLSSSFVLLPVHERVSRAKLLQRICGISGTIYWLMNFSWDFLIHASSSLLMIIPFLINFIKSGHISFDAVGGIFLLLLLHGLSSIPLSYFASFFVDQPSSGFSLLTLLNMLVGIISTVAMAVFVNYIPGNVQVQKILWFLRLFPSFATTWGINNIYFRSKNNVECSNYDTQVLFEKCKLIQHHCCTESVLIGERYLIMPYYTWDDFAAGKECFALFIMFFIWFGITILLESNFVEKCSVFIMNIKFIKDLLKPSSERKHIEYSDVAEELHRVEEIIMNHAFDKEALVTYELTKDFHSLRAVNNITFGVQKGECFGLLGVNGAGKTTTFRMLTGDLVPTSGDAYIKHASVQYSVKEFQMSIGYCPQSDALIDRLSTREMLQLFAHLRGIPRNQVDDNVNKIISMCDLEKFTDEETYTYSGGTKRKLALAVALIGAPPVILLDEPTSGVDPVSRRKIWETLITIKDVLGVSFILTSHSMDECEILCNRIAIMVNGEFRCLGSMQNLKSRFGQGYTIIAKLKHPTLKLRDMKVYIQQNIPGAQLKGYYHGTLHYHTIDTSLKWSKMFATMEQAKEIFNLEDYAVSGTRLEQIFLAFAREQKGFE